MNDEMGELPLNKNRRGHSANPFKPQNLWANSESTLQGFKVFKL